MKNRTSALFILIFLSNIVFFSFVQASNPQINLKLTLSGNVKSKISIYSIAEGKNNLVKDYAQVVPGQTIETEIPAAYLPGEFILLFEYYDKPGATKAQTAEKMLIINKQNIEFTANPKFINNPDSSFFQIGELENTVLAEFAQTTMQNMEMLDVLQSFLLKYDNQQSELYSSAIKEFYTRCSAHNKWIDEMLKKHKDLFCSNMFYFYYVPSVDWSGDGKARQLSLIENYFTGMDFTNKNILRLSYLKSWMDNYVNKYVELATSNEMITELFVTAGKTAIEKSKKGAPEFYGWMVDYFFNGYESMNIQAGITMLEPYIKDPNCLTYKRREIEKRVTGIQSLTNGTQAPDFSFNDNKGKAQNFLDYKTSAKYKLVLFWSADCEHCEAVVNELYKWHQTNNNKVDIFALSLDESDTEIPKWEVRHKQLVGWNHILTQGGINSKEAEAYFILSTPTMFLVDSKTNEIISSPASFDELMEVLK